MSITHANAAELRRPLHESVIGFRTDAKDPDRAKKVRCVPYIDARTCSMRLSMIDPGWLEEYEVLPRPSGNGYAMACTLTVEGTPRTGFGEGSDLKRAESDSLKRAAVKHGLGAFLYALPTLKVSEGGYWTKRTPQGEKVGGLNAKGVKELRAQYRKWIAHKELERFGEIVELTAIEDDERHAEPEPAEREAAREAPGARGAGITPTNVQGGKT